MRKEYLMTPGPCPIPSEVGLELAKPIIHHRTDEYHKVHKAVIKGLKKIFKTTKADVFIFASSGTGAMEGAVVNTLSKGDKAIVVRGGKFGQRWGEICQVYGVNLIPIDVKWGDAVDPSEIEGGLAANPDAKAVFVTLCETSTCVKTDIKTIGRIVKKTPAILIVDAISGLGCTDLQMDNWNLDVVVAGSQKGLMLPTGLAFTAVSEKAWGLVEKSTLPKYYFSYQKAKEAQGRLETAYSAPASLIVALKKSLDIILEEGIDNILARHARLAEATREAIKAIGLQLLSNSPVEGVTGFCVPKGISGEELKRVIYEKYGVNVAGGQGKLKGKIIRIAHMGYSDNFDIITAISALEMSLNDLGYKVELGKGVRIAQEILRRRSI